MRKLDLKDFIREISYLSKQKKEIEEKLNGLKKAVEVMYPNINLSLELKRFNSDKQKASLIQENKKDLKSLRDCIKGLIKKNNYCMTKEDLFNALEELNRGWRKKTIIANLSKMKSSGEIERIVEDNIISENRWKPMNYASI